MTSRALDRVSSRFDFGAAFGSGSRPLLVIPAKAGIQFLHLFSPSPSKERAKASTPPAEERVTFFAGTKKVTKEIPFKSEPPEELIWVRLSCAEFHRQFGFRGPMCSFADVSVASKTTRRSAPFENALVNSRQKNRPSDSPAHFRIAVRQTWARSDSKRCFFGDFLCTSKEGYPLAAGQRKHLFSRTDKFEQMKLPLFPLKEEESGACRE